MQVSVRGWLHLKILIRGRVVSIGGVVSIFSLLFKLIVRLETYTSSAQGRILSNLKGTVSCQPPESDALSWRRMKGVEIAAKVALRNSSWKSILLFTMAVIFFFLSF